MTVVPGVDHPEVEGEAEITLVGRGHTVTSRVEAVYDDTIVVRPSVGEFVDQVVVATGDVVEIFWKGPEDTRAMPATVTGTEHGAVVRWRFRTTGPAEVSQRRGAVRGRVSLPVEAGYGSAELTGQTVDISEAGARILLDGLGILPDTGTTMDLRIELGDGVLAVKAEVVRASARGARWSLSVRFPWIEERDQDRLRRRVFQALREERARLND